MTHIPCSLCFSIACDCSTAKRAPWMPPEGANGTTMLLLEHAAKIESLAMRVEELEKRLASPRPKGKAKKVKK